MRFRVRIQSVAMALLASAASLLLTTPSALADSALAGRWTGMVRQDSETYLAVMEFDREGGGRSDYPSLNCSGKLSGSGAKGVYQFRESIAGTGRVGEGSGNCIDGTISLSVSGDVMKWSWSGKWHGKPITAAGILTREAGSN